MNPDFIGSLVKQLFGVDASQILPPDFAQRMQGMQGPSFGQMQSPQAMPPGGVIPGQPPQQPQRPQPPIVGAQDEFGMPQQGPNNFPSMTLPQSVPELIGPAADAAIQGPGAQPAQVDPRPVPQERAQEIRPQQAQEVKPSFTGTIGNISKKAMRDTKVYPGYLVPAREVAEYIVSRAPLYGIDPETAVKIADGEGLRGWQSTARRPNGSRERSYGPFQLYIDGGVGNRFQKELGLNPQDPRHWRENVDFALKTASREGWGAWFGRKKHKVGVWDGIQRTGGKEYIPPSGAPSSRTSPVSTAAQMQMNPASLAGQTPMPQMPGVPLPQPRPAGAPGMPAMPTAQPQINYDEMIASQGSTRPAPYPMSQPAANPAALGTPQVPGTPMASAAQGASPMSVSAPAMLAPAAAPASPVASAGPARAPASPMAPQPPAPPSPAGGPGGVLGGLMPMLMPRTYRQMQAQQFEMQKLDYVARASAAAAAANRGRISFGTQKVIDEVSRAKAANPQLNVKQAIMQSAAKQFTNISDDEMKNVLPVIEGALIAEGPKVHPSLSPGQAPVTQMPGEAPVIGPAQPTTEVSTAMQFAKEAGIEPGTPEYKALMLEQLKRQGGGTLTQTERATAQLESAGVISPLHGALLRAGLITDMAPKNAFGERLGPPQWGVKGTNQPLSLSPEGSAAVTSVQGQQRVAQTIPNTEKPAPTSTKDLKPEQSVRTDPRYRTPTGRLDTDKLQREIVPVGELSENPADIVLGSGVWPGIASFVGGKVLAHESSTQYPTQIMGWRKALAQVRGQAAALAEIPRLKGVWDTFEKTLPNLNLSTTPMENAQNMIEMHKMLDKVSEAEAGTLSDSSASTNTREQASKNLAKIRRFRAVLPPKEALEAKLKALQSGEGGFVPLSEAVTRSKDVFEQGKKIVGEGAEKSQRPAATAAPTVESVSKMSIDQLNTLIGQPLPEDVRQAARQRWLELQGGQ